MRERLSRSWIPLVLLLWTVSGWVMGCGTAIKPYTDPTFRLDSQALANCKKSQQAQLCTADIKGVVDARSVAEPGEGVADCSQCVFNQKFTVLDSGGLRHTFYYKLHDSGLLPVTPGQAVQLIYLEGDRVGKGFAMSLLDADGKLLAALASGPGGELLTTNSRLGQVQVTTNTNAIAGEEQTECGIKVYRALTLNFGGEAIEILPGETRELTSDNRTYRFSNVNRFNWRNSTCADRSTPYAFVVYRTASSQ